MPIDSVEIKGLVETQRTLEQTARDLSGEPMRKAMRDSTLLVQRSAKEEAPVDTGRLRSSLTSRVIGEAKSITGVVGTNVKYAAAVEFGRGPHTPDMGPLTIWARRHNVAVKAIADAIQQYGTRAQPYMAPAVRANREIVTKKIEDAVRGIVRQ